MMESIPQLLQDIQAGLSYKRLDAANAMGKLDESSEEVIVALLTAKETDAKEEVKTAASSALEALIHKQYIQDHPEVLQKANLAVEAESTKQAKDLRRRFRIERVAFLLTVAIIAGVIFGSKTDLGVLGLTFAIAFSLVSIYFSVDFILGLGGGFHENVPAEEYIDIPNFDWKRFAREPLYFLVVLIGALVLGAIYWAFNRGK